MDPGEDAMAGKGCHCWYYHCSDLMGYQIPFLGQIYWQSIWGVPFFERDKLCRVGRYRFLILLLGLAVFRNRIKGLLLRDKESFYSRAFFEYMDRDKIGVAIIFIILMRTGESTLSSMVAPFMVDLGIKVHYGWLSSGVGLPFSIVGAMVGGFMISKFSLKKMIWPFLLAQNLTNLVYMAIALGLAKYLALNTAADVVTFIGSFNLFWLPVYMPLINLPAAWALLSL